MLGSVSKNINVVCVNEHCVMNVYSKCKDKAQYILNIGTK